MRGVLTIVQRELLGYFRSPIGYVFLVVFVLLAVGLPWFLDGFLESDEAGLQLFFRYLPWINVLFVPAVGMRLWAEEKNTGTWELLLTLPFSTTQAVIGKFVAGWLFVGVGLPADLPAAPHRRVPRRARTGARSSAATRMGFLMAGAVLGICSLMSSLTQNQVIAFILGVAGLPRAEPHRLERLQRPAARPAGGPRRRVNNFSFTTHFETARQGSCGSPTSCSTSR